MRLPRPGARIGNRNPAARAPRSSGCGPARSRRGRRGGGASGAGRAVNGPPGAWRMWTSCPANASVLGCAQSTDGGSRRRAKTSSIGRGPYCGRCRAPSCARTSGPAGRRCRAQLGVAGGRLPVVLAERVAAAAQRRHRRGRRRATPADPTGREADRQQHAAHQQADRSMPALPPARPPPTVTRRATSGRRRR